MSITDRFLLAFDEGLATAPENDANIALVPPRPGPNLHVSPDEAVIQARGRRRMPLSFSPDRDTNLQVRCFKLSIIIVDIVIIVAGKLFFWIKCSHQDTSVGTANKKENFIKANTIDSAHCEKAT